MSCPRAITHSAYRRSVMGRNGVVTSAAGLASQAGIQIMMAVAMPSMLPLPQPLPQRALTLEFYLERDGILLKEGLSVSIPDLVTAGSWPENVPHVSILNEHLRLFLPASAPRCANSIAFTPAGDLVVSQGITIFSSTIA